MVSPMPTSEFLSFALELAAKAAEEVLPRFQRCGVSRKDDGTLVTEADVAAESAIRGRIRVRYPAHGILGEEQGSTDGCEDRLWVIDPIDGTKCFGLGVPKFGTLIALLEAGTPILGVIHLPMTRETVYAETGGGCWYSQNGGSGVLVRVDSKASRLADAMISISGLEGSDVRGNGRWQLARLLDRACEVEFIGDCLQYALLARGRIHAAFDTVMRPWDSAAIVPCVREAGGVVSTLDGRYDDIVFGGSLLASGNRGLHEEILEAGNGLRTRS